MKTCGLCKRGIRSSKRRVHRRKCVECGKSFCHSHPNRTTCGEEFCRRAAKLRAVALTIGVPRKCSLCGSGEHIKKRCPQVPFPKEKQCSICEMILPLEDFISDTRYKWRRRSECRECTKEQNRIRLRRKTGMDFEALPLSRSEIGKLGGIAANKARLKRLNIGV